MDTTHYLIIPGLGVAPRIALAKLARKYAALFCKSGATELG